jgi:hypothetical protein
MATDAKKSPPPPQAFPPRGLRIFTYPKTIFLWPTMLVAIIAAIIMYASGNHTADPRKAPPPATAEARDVQAQRAAPPAAAPAEGQAPAQNPPRRFSTPQNIAGLLFCLVFFLNILIISVDFPRFTIIALILSIIAAVFILLYVNVYFNIIPPLVDFLEHIYGVANATFYLLIATAILINFAVIWVTRYLDYWVIMPNEILHNHGPFSDLERFPTLQLKFDKEIPDILEYALLGSGRLVLHVQGQPTAFVLDNVLWIDAKEEQLKKIMSRLEVRVTTDQEAATTRGQ